MAALSLAAWWRRRAAGRRWRSASCGRARMARPRSPAVIAPRLTATAIAWLARSSLLRAFGVTVLAAGGPGDRAAALGLAVLAVGAAAAAAAPWLGRWRGLALAPAHDEPCRRCASWRAAGAAAVRRSALLCALAGGGGRASACRRSCCRRRPRSGHALAASLPTSGGGFPPDLPEGGAGRLCRSAAAPGSWSAVAVDRVAVPASAGCCRWAICSAPCRSSASRRSW